MKAFLFAVLILLVSCERNSTSLPSEPIAVPVKEEIPPVKISYVIAVYDVEEPSFEYFEATRDINFRVISEAMAFTKWLPKTYCSNVQNIENFTEDDAYKMLDYLQNDIVTQPATYQMDIQTHSLSPEKKAEMMSKFTKITKRYYLSFKTYKEASEKRQSILYGNNS